MIDQLITALSKEVEMSAEEIADTIWLALQMQEFQAESVSSGFPLKKEDERGINKQESQADQETLPKPEPKTSELEETPNQPPEEQKAGIYPRTQQQISKSSNLSFKVPDAPSLREPLTLARALKPLMRRIPCGRELVLDEAATIQRIADEGLWIPVLRPTVEPWLDLELVVDEAISMQIWRHTIRDLERLLKNYGIFRDVRVWGLSTDEKEQVQIRRGIGATAKNQTSRSPKELIDPSGRRLVLVVSDCVSTFWRNGGVIPVLELWAKQGSMAIVQMLPKWLWKRTALGRASEVRLQGLTAGVSNQKLIAKEVSLWDELDEQRGVKVPIFTLEPDKVATWAQMVSGKGSIWTSGYVFKLDAPVKKETGLFNLAHGELSAEQRVQAFRVTASPMARKLAGLLASAPVLSLPIVRLIRETLLKDSQQVHVAEVFLCGLLKPLSEISADTNPDYIQYEFIEEVRELLVDSVPSNYVLNVVEEVSKYIAKKVGLSLGDFAAALRNSQQIRDSNIAEEVGYFATVTTQVLRRLGGDYARCADEIEAIRGDVPQLQEEGIESLYEAKLLIIGEGGVGKTSLAKKIANEENEFQKLEASTEGINVIKWQFQLDNGKQFRVYIWDFGGQEIYHQTHQIFLTEHSLYALVADTRQENTDFYYWLKVIELLSDNSPVLLIKNEKQDRKFEVNERQLRGEFPNLTAVLATNLATNRGLPEIKDAIKQYISRLPHVGTPLPKLWVRVRFALENDSRNYISVEDYCTLCRINGLTDRKEMLQLSRYLHDLGVCLHFQDDATLKHYVILKPEWGTTAVYKVLDNDTVKKNLGCFTQDDLKGIWKDSKYSDMRDELLQLMMRFKLCYLIPNRARHYIAPQLLEIDQPDYTWDDVNNLIVRYKYEFMPKGILTRLIVETHPWIEQQTLVWRSGVVLNKDQTRAEVIEHYNQREIRVRVTGNRKKELLTVVTHELDKIHQSFGGLQYRTLVPCNCEECKGSRTPQFYPLDALEKRLKAGRYQIECENSYQMVDIRRLILDPEFEKEVFISYAWGGESEKFVERLDRTLQDKGIKIIRDKRDLGYKGRIKAFMEQIGRGKCVIAVINDKYLKSPNCMFELVQVAKNGKFHNRIFPIVLADAQIYKPVARLKYIKHWEDEIKQLDEAMKEVGAANLQGFREEIDQYTEIRNTIAELTNLLKDMNTLTPDIHSQSEFEALLDAIEQRLDEDVIPQHTEIEPEITSDELGNILHHIASANHTEDDISALRQLLSSSDRQFTSQLGKYNVNIGQGQDIQVGDRIYYEWNDEAIQKLVEVIQEQSNSIPLLPKELPQEEYIRLKNLLASGRWREANDTTKTIILKAVKGEKEGWLTEEQIQNFPCQVLQVIDRLWVQYSNGRFGFSVQKRICDECEKDPLAFGERVGWRVQKAWISASQVIYTPANAPEGHLPWGIMQVVTMDNAALNAFVQGLRTATKTTIQQDWQKQLLADFMAFGGILTGDRVDKDEFKRNLEYELSHDEAWWEGKRLEELKVRKLFSLLAACPNL